MPERVKVKGHGNRLFEVKMKIGAEHIFLVDINGKETWCAYDCDLEQIVTDREFVLGMLRAPVTDYFPETWDFVRGR